MSQVAYLPTGKRERTKVANRQAILDAAREVFGELGYEAATVRDIIRRTGLASGTFYNYYRSKEEVFEALADDGARRFRPILREQFEKTQDFAAYLRGAIRAYFEFIANEHESWQARRPVHERQPHMQVETPEMHRVFEEVRDSFIAAMQRGDAPSVDADYLAAAAIAVAREVGQQMLDRRPIDIDTAADFAVNLILGGINALPRLTP
ncbi:MAG TPA: TetR/AcrR family transcriptional regulator [Caulobacteraceae bacterium]